MSVILIILAVMGFGAVVISVYVFMAAARNYVSDEHTTIPGNPGEAAQRPLVERSSTNRRSGRSVTFPLTVNGILIAQDRRILADRRMPA